MNCTDFKDQLAEYINEAELTPEMKEHIENCPDCKVEAENYFSVISMLTPQAQPMAHPDLKKSVMNHLKQNKKMKANSTKTKRLLRITAIAAGFLIIITLIPILNQNAWNPFVSPARAAETLLEKSLEAMKQINTMYIRLKIRTIEQDNFDLIGKDYDFVEHTITKSFTSPEKWKIEKPQRSVSFDGQNQYLYIQSAGYAIKGSKDAGYVGWLKRLLNPAGLLEKEISNAKQCKDCVYKVDKTDTDVILTINTKAQGSFENSYLRNSSIEESDSKIIYTFSKDDNLLKGLQVYIIDGEKEILILETEDIQYNKTLAENDLQIKLPAGVEWKDANTIVKNPLFTNIDSKKAAQLFFDACSKSEWKKIEDVFSILSGTDKEMVQGIKQYLGGLTVVSLGEPFKSGLYPGEFVPYEIKLSDGSIKEMNLALRNDNPNKVWMIDGGL